MLESGGDWFSNNQPHPQDLQMLQLGSSVPDFLSARSILPPENNNPPPLCGGGGGWSWKGLGVQREQTESSEASRGVGIVWCAAYSVPEACGHASELWKQDGELGELGDDGDMDETGVEVSGLNYR